MSWQHIKGIAAFGGIAPPIFSIGRFFFACQYAWRQQAYCYLGMIFEAMRPYRLMQK